MIKIRKYYYQLRSLNAKMLYTICMAIFTAALIYFLCSGVGDFIVDRYYMSSDAVSARKAQICTQFSSYVNSRNIASSDSAAIAAWSKDHDYVTLLIYNGSDLRMRAREGKLEQGKNILSYEQTQYAAQFGKLYPIHFADGVYEIGISENSQQREYTVNTIVALVAASIAFVSVMLMYVQKTTRRIVHLARDADTIGRGNLEKPIVIDGSDEIAMLGGEMDNMRKSVIKRMENERRAWQANSDLITSISHDIRTPMTSMIGYLELLKATEPGDAERIQQFTQSAYSKAMELKDLTDELFKYFLVFGKADIDLNREDIDAMALLEQLLGEPVIEMRDLGFTVDTFELTKPVMINVDILYLKRVVDNVFSNVRKYADMEKPVTVAADTDTKTLTISVTNYISKSRSKADSTKIGLQTCYMIMEHMGGRFEVNSDEEMFNVEIKIPIPEEGEQK